MPLLLILSRNSFANAKDEAVFFANPLNALSTLQSDKQLMLESVSNYLKDECLANYEKSDDKRLNKALANACLLPQLVDRKKQIVNLSKDEYLSPVIISGAGDIQELKSGAFYVVPFLETDLTGPQLVFEWLVIEIAIKKSINEYRILVSNYWSKHSKASYLYYIPKLSASLSSYTKFTALDQYWSQLKCNLNDISCNKYKSYVSSIYKDQLEKRNKEINYLKENMNMFSKSSETWVKRRWLLINELIRNMNDLQSSSLTAEEILKELKFRTTNDKKLLALRKSVEEMASVAFSQDDNNSIALTSFASLIDIFKIYEKKTNNKYSSKFAPEFVKDVIQTKQYEDFSQEIKKEIIKMANSIIHFLNEEGEIWAN